MPETPPHERRAHLLTRRLTGWRKDQLGGLSRSGLLVATVFIIAANTPSLLPRPWQLQGLITAICALLGYAAGWSMGQIVRALGRWLGVEVQVNVVRARRVQWLLAVLAVVGVIAFPILTIEWQQRVSEYVGLPPPGVSHVVGALFVFAVAFAALLLAWRLVAGLSDWFLTRMTSRRIRAAFANVIASALTVLTVVVAYTQIVSPVMMSYVWQSSERVNATAPWGRERPTSPLRTGGPGSHFSWESIGQDGAKFVSMGPDAADIEEVTGRPALEPIRVMVGVQPTLEATRDGVLAEMDRTGAWERGAIVVATATTTGYLNMRAPATVEYLLDGDVATVSMAYSTLPSAFGYLTQADVPPHAARMLLDAVRERVAAMPTDQRPKVYATGESLGAYGGESAFTSPEQMLAELDGAVWSGTPEFAKVRRELTESRMPGSTALAPIIDMGRHIRFAGTGPQVWTDEYDRPLGPWEYPRVVYLQHPSDPVAWWSPSLLVSSPDWLRETRENTSMSQMSWWFLVTFWQVTADMAVSSAVPMNYGHRYYALDMVPAWEAVLGVEGLDPARREAIMDAVNSNVND